MKFKIRQNILPKNIKLIQKYLDEESSEESSYYSSDSYESSNSSNSSYEDSSESGSEESGSCDSDESFDSVSTAERNFSKFMKEFDKTRVYSIKENILSISYNFDTERLGGKWRRHLDKSIDIYHRFLNTDKESLRKGLMFIEISKI